MLASTTTALIAMAGFQANIPEELLQIEDRYLQGMKEKRVDYSVFDIPVGKGRHIHTLKAQPLQSTADALEVPIVLLHGFTGSLGNWRNLIPLLTARGHTVYAIDQLGWGYSSRPHDFSNWELPARLIGSPKAKKTVNDVCDFWVDSLEAWRKTVGLDRIHIVGHSLGGWVAGEYALRYPKAVAKATLACSVGVYKHDRTWFGDGIGALGIFMEATRGVFGVNWPFRLLRGMDWVTGKRLLDPKAAAGNWTDTLQYIRAINSLPPSGEIAAEYIKRRADPKDGHVLWGRLPKVRFPISFIYCENDTTATAFDSAILGQLQHSPRVDVSTIGFGAGHSSQSPEIVEAFAAALLGDSVKEEYMKQHPRGIVQSCVVTGGRMGRERERRGDHACRPDAGSTGASRAS